MSDTVANPTLKTKRLSSADAAVEDVVLDDKAPEDVAAGVAQSDAKASNVNALHGSRKYAPSNAPPWMMARRRLLYMSKIAS